MPTVGAYARIDLDAVAETREALSQLAGVTLFDLDEEGKVGLLVEAADLDGAHSTITNEVHGVDGVLGVWPIYVDVEDLDDDARRPQESEDELSN
ncbi:MAG: hypothetical protein ACF8NJ_10635 [Phycisphaerales bacterium JB038]